MASVVAPQLEIARGDIWQCRRAVQRRLAAVRRAVRAHLIWEGLAWIVGAAIAFAAAGLLIDRLVRPEIAARAAMLALGAAGLVVIAWQRLVRPLRGRLNDLDLAELLDRRRPGVGQRLTNVLQLPELLLRGKIDGSPAMIAAAVMDDAAALDSIDLKETLNVSRRRKFVTLLVGALALVLIVYCLFPSATGLWIKRWFGGSRARWPQHTYLKVLGLTADGRLLVPRGEASILEVDALPEFTQAAGGWRVAGRSDPFFIPGEATPKSEIPDSVTIEYRSAGDASKQGTFAHFEAGRFRYELPPLTERATFSVRGGDDWTESMEIDPIDRPAVKDVEIAATVPGRAEPEIHHAGQQEAQLLFLPTTRLQLTMESDQPLASARIVSHDAEALPVEMVDETHYRTQMEMKASTMLEYELVSKNGGLTSKPYFLSIDLLVDRPPRVGIRATGVGRRITPQANIPVVIHAVDDFGIAQICAELERQQVVDSKPQVTLHQPFVLKFNPQAAALPKELDQQTTVKLADLNIMPGNAIRLRARGTDAYVLGPQDGVSRWLAFQVVTPEELFYEILTRQRELRARFRKALEMAKTQVETIPKITRAEESGGLSRVHQVVARQVGQISSQLDATLQEMICNDLSSPQARDLLESSILAPLRKLHDEAFALQGQRIQAAIARGEFSEDDRQQLLTGQQDIVKQMQKILAQMTQWESFVDVVSQLRQIIKSQNELLETTKKTQKERIKNTFD